MAEELPSGGTGLLRLRQIRIKRRIKRAACCNQEALSARAPHVIFFVLSFVTFLGVSGGCLLSFLQNKVRKFTQ
jgi:hypothetical protein